MNNSNRMVLATYLSLTLLILIFTTLYALESPALYLKFGVRTAMLLTVLILRKKFWTQRLLILAFLCTILSDYFFVFLRATSPDLPNRELFGMVGFIAAYIFLIAAFQRRFSFGKREVLTLLPFVIVFGIFLSLLAQYAVGFMFVAAVILGIVLCYTGMTMVSTLYRGYFTKSDAWLIAISGCVLFFSDIVVAFSIFHPAFKPFLLWKENIIWGTYMLGWTLLLIIAGEEKLTLNSSRL
ncbi:lysoplasmalogenase family protein [Acidaminobacter hydrogenoformans]|uniref:YhhN-like protein n=1 Tax=Acidaminobacter hydrogenoformans DSM 2784 TaxID=1120920 RepID=A0A1G5S118_9FIRM|nr:lysoplasmalogenase family protein [Acidaminobacter hydrogenoformans]SCZ79838.1 YhhN-like protein [Acidaminobacter hydrogenoformans DSM 2784]